MSVAERPEVARLIISRWVRRNRLFRGWSQYTLAKKSGLDRGVIAQYEQQRRTPGQKNMGRLLDVFKAKDGEREEAMKLASGA